MSAELGSRRWLLALPLTAAVVATAACGTTVPVTSQAARGQGDSTGLAPEGTTGALPGGNAPTAPGAGGQLGTSSGPGAGGGAPTTVTPGTGQQPGAGVPSIPSNAVGVTPTTITIGAMTANGAGQFQRSLGFDKGATGDQVAMVRSVVDWLNKRGGIGGRKIRMVNYDVPVAEAASDPSSAYQAACTAFTQDNKVFAVASIISHVPPNFYECLRARGVLVIAAIPPVSSRFFQQFAGTVYSPGSPSYTRVLADSVDALWADGWLTSSSKVGVVGFDTPDSRATVTDGLVPALKRHGLTLTSDFYTSPDTAAASAYSSGVLKFKTYGVDRVFFAPGGQPIYFGLAADQAAYHPFMEMSTLEYPGPVAATLPASTLRGAAGLGWSPYLDLDNASAAKVPTPAKAECVEAVKAAQQDLSTGTTLAIATWICDDWFFLRDVLARVPSISPAGFRSAVGGLGSSFRSANTFRTFFAPNRTADGAAAYRLNKYDDACSCFKYTSGIRPMP